MTIALASLFNWNIQQLDIKSADLNAELHNDIYMKLPEDHENYNNGYYKLNKALYSLKQAGRKWNQTIRKLLNKKGLYQLRNKQCLFVKQDNKNNIMYSVALYVDDIIITCIKEEEIFNIINIIKNNFKISKREEINHILNLNVRKNKFGYTVSQENNIENTLKKFNIKENQKVSIPCTGDDVKLINNTPFDKTIQLSALGCLIHIS